MPLPDIANELADEEDVQSVHSNGTDTTWEENWLFKKRKLKTDTQQPIGMLVPSPTVEVKALIGDVNADETSDLSEAETSDVEEQEASKTNLLIGSSNEPSLTDKKAEASTDSLRSMQSLTSNNSGNSVLTEAKNNLLLIDDESAKQPQKPLEENPAGHQTLLMNTLMETEAINSIIKDAINKPTEHPMGEIRIG